MNSQKPLTVIIVDDDQDDLELLQFLFTKNENFELIGCFDSGIKVIEAIVTNGNVPDILIIDMYMPIYTGTEVVNKLIESGVAPNLNSFIISTTINTTEQKNYSGNKTVQFLKKPVSLIEINDLPEIVQECLNHNNNTKV